MPLPEDRLSRAGATRVEIEHMLARPEAEIKTIAHRLQGEAETGVAAFIDEYRRLFVEPEPEAPARAGAKVKPEPAD